MKKLFCLIMVITICCGMSLSSLAYEKDDISKPGNMREEFENVDKVADNVYIYNSDIGKMQMGRLDINVLNEEEVNEALLNPNLSDEVKEKIEKNQQKAKQEGIELICTVFSPELLPDKVSDLVETNAVKYSTYNGSKMRSDLIYTYGISTGWEYISSGAKASTVADGVTNVVLAVLSKSKVVSIVSAGKTVLDFFVDMWGTSYITGHRNDYFQMRVIYDDVSQYTYRQFVEGTDDWRLGLSSQKVTLKKIGTEQYYFNGNTGKTTTKDVSVSVVFESPNFSSPWAKAYQWITDPQGEFISWKVGGKVFLF